MKYIFWVIFLLHFNYFFDKNICTKKEDSWDCHCTDNKIIKTICTLFSESAHNNLVPMFEDNWQNGGTKNF